MNREQADHILDAYTMMARASMESQEEADAKHALREVILDAMTGYGQTVKQSGVTYPHITLPATGYPTNWDGSPKVTCNGIDPLFKQTTGVGE